LLILDDALSAVDASTERIIQNNLKGQFVNRTVIIIAHRISTVRQCDTIVVLSNGSITEQGTHDQLLLNNGFYTRVYGLQYGNVTQ
jgi:ABC-type multidrug transport system fused ATPase/permease subunit